MHELMKKNPLTGSISEFWYSWHLTNFICESFNSSNRFFLHLCDTFYPFIWSIFRRVTWWCTHKKATAFDCDTEKNNTTNWWKCYDTRCCLSRFWVRFGERTSVRTYNVRIERVQRTSKHAFAKSIVLAVSSFTSLLNPFSPSVLFPSELISSKNIFYGIKNK